MKNKKGYTLIEIITAIFISTIVMVITGTLLLNSIGYFQKTADTDADKQTLSNLSAYVNEELRYASEVSVSPQKPQGTGWHYLYWKDGMLYRDGVGGEDMMVFQPDFYHQRTLSLSLQADGEYSLTLTYALLDNTSDIVSETDQTLEFMNLKAKSQQQENFHPFMNLEGELELSHLQSNYKIYYKQENIRLDLSETTGTVADQMSCLTTSNDREAFVEGKQYEVGDFFYQLQEDDTRIYYQVLNKGTYWLNDIAYHCKKIDAYHQINSAYLKQDVVLYQAPGEVTPSYYQCIKDILDAPTLPILPIGSKKSDEYWKKIHQPQQKDKRCELPADAA